MALTCRPVQWPVMQAALQSGNAGTHSGQTSSPTHTKLWKSASASARMAMGAELLHAQQLGARSVHSLSALQLEIGRVLTSRARQVPASQVAIRLGLGSMKQAGQPIPSQLPPR